MKTITINIPDDCEVKIVKKEEKKERKFKKGDVIYACPGLIAIFERAKEDVMGGALRYQEEPQL